jgi:uncharacterized membrane protein YsdA (DUF1294 family)
MSEFFLSIIPLYFIVLGIVTFILWGVDKFRARANLWRIPERTLLIFTLLGGSFGALAGMVIFRHKIRKPLFWILVGLACVLHLILLLYVRKS